MSIKNECSKDIWDVIFNLDSSYFPLSRNYIEQPRGSSNPINSQVKMKPKKEYLDFAKKMNPVDLYAIDFELNLLFRKLADFILFADNTDVWEDSPVFYDIVSAPNKTLENLVEGINLSVSDMTNEALYVADAHINCGENPLDNISEDMRNMAELQYTIQYYIENSDWDWRIKAEAFLRSHYLSNFEYADDETVIYLSRNSVFESNSNNFINLKHQEFNFAESDINNKIHDHASRVASRKWDQYRSMWDNISYSDDNPFEQKADMSGLRYIQMKELSFFNELSYNSESKHLLSCENIKAFCRLLTFFRTGLENQEIQRIASKIYSLIRDSIEKQHWNGYNYTVGDRVFLLSLLYHFLGGRFSKVEYDDFFIWSRNNLLVDPWKLNPTKRNWSTLDYLTETPLLPLSCFNIFAVWYSKPDNFKKYISETFKDIVKKQHNYGFWYDNTFNPEFMTVLALDAFNVDQYSCLSFPNTKIEYLEHKSKPEQTKDVTTLDADESPFVEYNHYTKKLTFGDKAILLSNREIKLMEALYRGRFEGLILPSNKILKSGVDSLRKKVGGKENLKYVIKMVRSSREKRGYIMALNMKVKYASSVALGRTYRK